MKQHLFCILYFVCLTKFNSIFDRTRKVFLYITTKRSEMKICVKWRKYTQSSNGRYSIREVFGWTKTFLSNWVLFLGGSVRLSSLSLLFRLPNHYQKCSKYRIQNYCIMKPKWKRKLFFQPRAWSPATITTENIIYERAIAQKIVGNSRTQVDIQILLAKWQQIWLKMTVAKVFDSRVLRVRQARGHMLYIQ